MFAVTTRSWVSLTYLIVFGSIIAFTAYSWLHTVAPASRVATYAYVNPVVAVLLGWADGGGADRDLHSGCDGSDFTRGGIGECGTERGAWGASGRGSRGDGGLIASQTGDRVRT